ncbi:MAG: cobyric acid synthase [Proteobacteria bacterium]|nr:cobyric acid synthase [Pseudomonadota bacterium]
MVSPGTRPARTLMVAGTTSGAGKSLLTTALARYYARAGLKVAPFKAQNMSNNARVVEGGEMGSAQYLQALAARAVPEVRMNPVLLKPESDTASQVVVLGQRHQAFGRLAWRERARALWPLVQDCLDQLRQENDLVILEGAGSPAEINLMDSDIVNLRLAEVAGARTLLVCDIDRGGAFAHLYGTWLLVSEAQRRLIHGFVLNKFRGDAGLLAPAPERLRELTGVPVLGVLPMWREHGLPEEDGVFEDGSTGAGLRIGVVAYPRISNLDEFAPLRRMPGVALAWVRTAAGLSACDLVILPGSKHVPADLAWLRAQGLEPALRSHVAAGRPLLAVCGGLQMLGGALRDPDGVEGEGQGLGLLPLLTEYESQKRYRRGRYAFQGLSGYWSALSGVDFEGYEIRHGRTHRDPAGAADATEVLADGLGWQSGPVLALYAHGLFENAGVLRALFGHAVPTLEETFEGLADFVAEHLGRDTLDSLIR